METMDKRKPEAFITEEQVKVIQAKEWLNWWKYRENINVVDLSKNGCFSGWIAIDLFPRDAERWTGSDKGGLQRAAGR